MAMAITNTSICNAVSRTYVHHCFFGSCNCEIKKILMFEGDTKDCRKIFTNKFGYVGFGKGKYIGSCLEHYIYLAVLKYIIEFGGHLTKEEYDSLMAFPMKTRKENFYSCLAYYNILKICNIAKSQELYDTKLTKNTMRLLMLSYHKYLNSSTTKTQVKEYEKIYVGVCFDEKIYDDNMGQLYTLASNIWITFRNNPKIFDCGLTPIWDFDSELQKLTEIIRRSKFAEIMQSKISVNYEMSKIIDELP